MKQWRSPCCKHRVWSQETAAAEKPSPDNWSKPPGVVVYREPTRMTKTERNRFLIRRSQPILDAQVMLGTFDPSHHWLCNWRDISMHVSHRRKDVWSINAMYLFKSCHVMSCRPAKQTNAYDVASYVHFSQVHEDRHRAWVCLVKGCSTFCQTSEYFIFWSTMWGKPEGEMLQPLTSIRWFGSRFGIFSKHSLSCCPEGGQTAPEWDWFMTYALLHSPQPFCRSWVGWRHPFCRWASMVMQWAVISVTTNNVGPGRQSPWDVHSHSTVPQTTDRLCIACITYLWMCWCVELQIKVPPILFLACNHHN